MELADVNNQEDAKILFEKYDIPYSVISRGVNKGMLRVKNARLIDAQRARTLREELTANNYGYLCDHCNTFRDENDNTAVTFSPYGLGGHGGGSMQLGSWEIEISDLSIYCYGTKTVVARSI